MAKQSAGILLYKPTELGFEVLLVHPGGPFWAKKEDGVWSIPKGEFADGEDALHAAKREFQEEVGKPAPDSNYIELGSVKQSGDKVVHAWAVESDFDASNITSNLISIDWPPRSNKKMEIPEVDRAAWFPLSIAPVKLIRGQIPLVEALAQHLGQAIPIQPSGGTEPVPKQASLF